MFVMLIMVFIAVVLGLVAISKMVTVKEETTYSPHIDLGKEESKITLQKAKETTPRRQVSDGGSRSYSQKGSAKATSRSSSTESILPNSYAYAYDSDCGSGSSGGSAGGGSCSGSDGWSFGCD